MKVLVTAVGPGSIGEQVCEVLSAEGTDLMTASLNDHPTRAVAYGSHLRLPHGSDPAFVDALFAASAAHRCDFIIPTSEAELLALAASSPGIAPGMPALIMNRPALVAALTDKGTARDLLAERGVQQPRTWLLRAESDLAAIDPTCGPWVIKPTRGSGSRLISVAQSEDALTCAARELLRVGVPCVVQQYVGNPDGEFTIGVLSSPEGSPLSVAIMQRDLGPLISTNVVVPNRTGRMELGRELVISSGVSQGHFVDDGSLASQALAIAEALDSRGPLNIQGRLVGDELVVFEINPRFSGTTRARAIAGCNEPHLMLLASQGGGPSGQEPVAPRSGRLVRYIAEDFIDDARMA